MDEIDIPQYFLCPISLQLMKDPVTTVTGITYDRESIEQWLATAASGNAAAVVCPVTKQPLASGSDLIPNHILWRLIQAWCVANANRGIDRIPTPKSASDRSLVLKLIRDVNRSNNNILLQLNALKKMDELAGENEPSRRCMAEAGMAKAMVLFILRCFKEGQTLGLEKALRILQLTWSQKAENKQLVGDNLDFIHSILWVLNSNMEKAVKIQALMALRTVLDASNWSLMQRLNLDFFRKMVKLLKENVNTSQQAVKSLLNILIQTCPSGRNRTKIVEAGAVFELIEMELSSPEKKISELIFCLLAQLCSCADGRQQLLKHAGGVAVMAKRLLRVSPATDDAALSVIESLARFAATREVAMEMLRVGAVSKLCMVLQADCAGYLKKKAREILRLHSNVWSNSPCIQVYLVTRYPK
ncbi:Ubiquitin--protein ligase [Handroanthus impetiginosus]|uniref:U-box domain-containing protein n=1 Tax=Handroanthus impetiginosus TaxID=429701 RepID=A0A2G9GD46_9LAMI|nr:Ubiquitin--protein ligase [Handroanthus impetiginosus]